MQIYKKKIAGLQQSLEKYFAAFAGDGRGERGMLVREGVPAKRRFATQLQELRRNFAVKEKNLPWKDIFIITGMRTGMRIAWNL